MPFKDKDQKREYQRQWCAKRRREFFYGKSCVKCDSIDRLELDHVDPATKVSNSIWSWSEKRRVEELAKCQILCYKCHLAKSSKEHAKGQSNGSSKLTQKQVDDLRIRVQNGASAASVAKELGVNPRTAQRIVTGELW